MCFSSSEGYLFGRCSLATAASTVASTIDLVSLRLLEVPDASYIPPDVMATCLTTLPHLRFLFIDFHSLLSTRHNRGGRRCPAPPMTPRDTLPGPSLTSFNFRGTSEHLRDLVTKIDAPFLGEVNISFFNRLTVYLAIRTFPDSSVRWRFFSGVRSGVFSR
jgi:hypothetical protein